MKKRIIAFITVLCMTVAILPLKEPVHFFKNIITVDAYEKINEYPDFSLDIYVADLMTDPVRDSTSYRHLGFYINENESPNSIIYKPLNQDAGFRTSVAAWETLTFKPSNITETTLNQMEYYEAIILKALKCKTNDEYLEKLVNGGVKLADDGYDTFINILETEYFAVYDFNNIDWDSLSDVQKGDLLQAFEKSFEKEFPLLNTTKDVMTVFSEILNVCTNLKEAYDRTVSYQMCYELSEHMKHVVNDLYNNCSSADNMYMKEALYNINQACKEYNFFTNFDVAADCLGKLSIEYLMKFCDKMWDTVITFLPGGKSILIGQIVGQNISNWLFSTDETIEQYHKMEALMNFETLVRSVTNYEIQQFRANKTEENAKILFSSIELFFNTYDLSCDFANDMAKIVYTKGIVNIFQDNSQKYNEITNSIRNIRRYAAEAYDSLINTYWLADLEYEHPDIYEAMVKQNEYEEYMKTFVAVTGVKFPMHEIEVGLEDLGAGLCGAYVTPSDAAIKEIVYTSSDPSVAEMINDSLVIYKVGTATITAKSADGGFTDEMTVNVVEGHGNDGMQPTQIVTAKVGDTFETGGLEYEVTSNDEVELTRHTSDEPVGALYIPDMVSYGGKLFNVTSIGYTAFNDCSGLTSIVIPDGVKEIKGFPYDVLIVSGAFSGCSGLTSINIPDSVASVGNNAFKGCSGLTSITIPDSVTSVGNNAFGYCTGLQIVTIGSNATFRSSTFVGCNSIKKFIFADGRESIGSYITNHSKSSLEEVVIPDSVKYIGESTFSNCSKLTNIKLPNNLTTIEPYTFQNCSELTSITIPYGVTSIDDSAFSCCSNLANITIPDSVTSIGSFSFENCSKLTSITLPNCVTKIGDSAFYGCSSLKNIVIPDLVTTVADLTFHDCTGLQSVVIGSSVKDFSSDAFVGCQNIKKLIFADGLESINFSMTKNLESSLEQVIVPNSVKNIGQYTFKDCSKLRKITIPDGVTNIGKEAFYGCSGLTNIVIPDSVITVDSYAFRNCTGLQSVTIGSSVTEFSDDVFYDCNNIKKLTFADGLESIDSNMTRHIESSLEEVIIPDSVANIDLYTFYNCSKLTNIYIPPKVKVLEFGVFTNCTNLKNIVISEGVTEIKGITDAGSIMGAFSNCSGLTSITIPNSVTKIGESAFRGCSGLTSITIPASVTTVNSYAFYRCDSLSDVYYTGSESEWNNISIDSYSNSPLTNATIHFNFVPSQGDVNMDGSFNIADVVMMQKWLLRSGKLTYWQAGDLYEDNVIDVFDLCLMKKKLING